MIKKKTFFPILFFLLLSFFCAACNPTNQAERNAPHMHSSSITSPAVQGSHTDSPLQSIPASPGNAVPSSAAAAVQSALPSINNADHAVKNAVIAFTFDDGYISDYKIVFPILKKYNIRGTSYIVPGFMNKNRKTRLTWSEVKEMAEYGWVFGCHTFDHKDLKTLSAKQIKKNMEAVDHEFEAHGLKPPVVGAYPYGSYDEKVISALKPYRKQERKAFFEHKFVDIKHVNPYKIDSISADMTGKERLRILKTLVDDACKQKSVVVFRAHSMFKKKKNDTGRFLIQTDSRLFEQLVSYCVEKGCVFVTMEELMTIYQS